MRNPFKSIVSSVSRAIDNKKDTRGRRRSRSQSVKKEPLPKVIEADSNSPLRAVESSMSLSSYQSTPQSFETPNNKDSFSRLHPFELDNESSSTFQRLVIPTINILHYPLDLTPIQYPSTETLPQSPLPRASFDSSISSRPLLSRVASFSHRSSSPGLSLSTSSVSTPELDRLSRIDSLQLQSRPSSQSLRSFDCSNCFNNHPSFFMKSSIEGLTFWKEPD
ncbi:hypothetical protein JCM3765_001987 [Sporobolomyces pararoseus]